MYDTDLVEMGRRIQHLLKHLQRQGTSYLPRQLLLFLTALRMELFLTEETKPPSS